MNHVCGLDGKDEIKEDIVNLAAKKDAVKILTKTIRENDFNDEYLKKCKPLLKEIGKKEENLLDCYKDID